MKNIIIWTSALIVGAVLGWLGIGWLNGLLGFIATAYTRLFQFVAVPTIALAVITTLQSPLLTSPKGEENHPDSTSSLQSKEPCSDGKSSPLGGTGGGLPLILMGYLNPIMQFGFEQFCQRCVEVGIDGVIIPDLPFKDYLEEYKPVADRYDIRIIMLITPETSDERIRFIDEHTDGFIYMVSSASTTGAQKEFGDQKQAYFSRIQAMHLKHPCMIGFGISNKQTLEAAQSHAAGAIIGSKFVNLLEETGDAASAMDKLLNALKC